MSKRSASSSSSSSFYQKTANGAVKRVKKKHPLTWFREYRSLLWLLPFDLVKEIVRLYGLLMLKQPKAIFDNVPSYLGKRSVKIPRHWADPNVLKSYDLLFPFLESNPRIRDRYMKEGSVVTVTVHSNLGVPVWDPNYDRYVYKSPSGVPYCSEMYAYERMPKLMALYLFYQTYRLSLTINIIRD